MGVDEGRSAKGDQQVVLRRAGLDEDEVAAPVVAAPGRGETRLGEAAEMPRDAGIAQCIAGGRPCVRPQGAGDDAHAVEPVIRVSPTKAEPRARQRLGPGGEAFRAHRGIG